MPVDPRQDPRRRSLRRLKLIALAWLLAMLCLFVLSHLMGASHGPWPWVLAFSEAAMVGALADWFAVVALFRHPLGLPIPHTAIIPSNKARIADNLAVFVRDHFLDPPALIERLRVFDPAARLGTWLAEPQRARSAAAMARTWMLESLDLLDEQAVRDTLHGYLSQRLMRWDAGRTVSDLLGLLTRDGRHQVVLDEVLRRLGDYLDGESVRQRASAIMVRHARREWPRIARALNLVKSVDSIADTLADRLARAVLSELHEILAQPEHPLRRDYEEWLAGYLRNLRDDPAMQAQVDAIKRRIVEHPDVQAYVLGLWDELRAALRRNLQRDDSTLARHLENAVAALGSRLASDPVLRDALNAHLLAAAQSLATRLRHGVTEHIAQTVKGWDDRRLVEELELSVGRDLQYIRFNGTLVGGLIGLALHAISLALGS
jgi:uncharacterized membrane-anchored protein YjiN (DUF445 family)